jgi:hypothetical protein
MHRSAVEHALLVGAVLAFCVLAVGACGAPEEEARPRPLPDGPRKLEPGAYRTEQFEPAFSFEVGEGWSTAEPEAYDLLVITRGDEGGGVLGFTNLKGARFFEPTRTGSNTYETDVPKDVVGWFRGHPYLETRKADPVEVGGIEGVRLDLVVGDLPEGHHSEWCGSGCVNLIRFGSGSPPLTLWQDDKARLIVLEYTGGETVITGFAIRAAGFDDHAPEAQKVLDTVRWRGS